MEKKFLLKIKNTKENFGNRILESQIQVWSETRKQEANFRRI